MDGLRIGVLVVGALFAAYGGLCMFGLEQDAREPETDEEWRRRQIRNAREAQLPEWRRLLLALAEPITAAALLVFAVAAAGGFEFAQLYMHEGEFGAMVGFMAGMLAAHVYTRHVADLRRAITAEADLRAELKRTKAQLQEERRARIFAETKPERDRAEAERRTREEKLAAEQREREEKLAAEKRKQDEDWERARTEGRIIRLT
ncbi:hypothetical protein [Anaeromyxobacter diazotrophicus]|uniref:Uncharacterized protein n=1 Tax=Anaeromyxobacter diazotrophicus TaxID=2590199 RepID=A0A7I9VID8_9BACT|nr:hypothetical protein [Anaeromyxobacter diazotrophicus]GEJ56125.1 hypothetical protein AMYX_08660 [Anaeromyxobacter diazotrophicus]